MIYLLYGEDAYRSRENLQKITRKFLSAEESKPNFFRFTSDSFDSDFFLGLANANTIFGKKYLISAERILSNKDFQSLILDNLDNIKKSDNIFIFWEEELAKDILKKIESRTEKAQEFAKLTNAQTRSWIRSEAEKLNFNIGNELIQTLIKQYGSDLYAIKLELKAVSLDSKCATLSVAHLPDQQESAMFDLADAFASRDKGRAIKLFAKYRDQGNPAEEIFWRLRWQIKTILAVKKMSEQSLASIKKDTGFHEFVIKKALASQVRFKEGELESIFRYLLTAHSKSKIGLSDLDYNIFGVLLKL